MLNRFFEDAPRLIVIAGAVATGVLVFVAGAATASAFSGDVMRGKPIINPNAWNEQPREAIVQVAYEGKVATCNPWDVSEAAIEEILLEMQRRGWRPPSQGDAIALADPSGVKMISAADPDAPMPRSYGVQTSAIIVGDAEIGNQQPVEDAVLTNAQQVQIAQDD